MENRIEKLQEEYLKFCLSLVQKLPENPLQQGAYSVYVISMYKELKESIAIHFQNLKSPEIIELEHRIEELRVQVKSGSRE